MKIKSRIACISAAVAAFMYGSGSVQATDLTWDADPVTPAVQDGSGNWDTTTANWFDGTNNVTWSNSNPDSALFGNTTSTSAAGAPYSIEFSEPITVQNLSVGLGTNGTTYNFSDFNGGSLTVAGNISKVSGFGNPQFLMLNGIALTSGDHTFALKDTGGDAAPELTINAALNGAGNVIVDTGASNDAYGTLAFNVDGSYTGTTTISKGRLVITTSGALGATAAGTTISNQGTLSIGGSGTTVVGGLNIAEPITITRDTYTGGDFGRYNAALIFNNNGPAQTHTLSGPLVVDSADARIAVNSNTLVIPTNITQGPNVASSVLSFTGDFAGIVQLTGDNSAVLGGIKLVNGVEVQVNSQANLGGPNSPITFAGDATLGIMNGFMTDFGTHVINTTSFSGGLDIPTGQTFNMTTTVTGGTGLGKRGGGTLNFNAPLTGTGNIFWDAGTVNINNSVSLGTIHLRSPIVNIGTGGSLTLTGGNWNSFGQDSTGTNGGPDIAVVNLTGTGSLVQTNGNDFNVSDGPNTQGTINISNSATLTTGGITALAKSAGAVGTINQMGGTVTINRTGNFGLVLGDRNGTGNYNLSGGTLTSAGEFYVGQGGSGVGFFTQTGGTVNQNNWFVVGREGGQGTVDISAGTFNKAGGGNAFVGENNAATKTSTMTVRGTGVWNQTSGEFWVGQAGGSGILNIQDSASFTVNNWLALGRASGASVGVLNMSGGTLTKQGGGFLAVGSGGTGTFNQTGGTLNSNGSFIGEASNGTANLSGGTSTFTGTFNIGQNGGVFGTLNISNTANVTVPNVIFGNNGGNGGGTLNLDGGTLTANSFASGAGTGAKTFNFNGGTLRAGADSATFMQGLTTANVKNGGAIIDSNGYTVTIGQALIANGTGGVTKNGLGAVTLAGNNTYTGATTVNAGTLNLTQTSRTSSSLVVANTAKAVLTARTSPGAKVLQVGTLNLNSTGTLDLNDNDLVVTNGSFTALQSLVFQGYRGSPDTTATGIVSTTSQTVHGGTTILALFDNSLAGFGDWPAGSGQTIGANAIVGKYTYIGDTNMDGQVTPQDYTAVDANLNTSVDPAISWFYGDTNFDGNIDASDYTGIDAALNLGVGNPLAAQGLAAVPEPGSLTLLAAGAAGILRRRRRV